ncbi:18S rRNA biogenesis protein RCL1 [Dirofilaria immitis]|nr:18S rRNA biogenesis protein RCL1 [Dirofilaria immitis]
MDQQELRFEGCNFFRQRLAYSLLSGRAVAIAEIRSYDDEPGIKGTKVEFSPGVITGGQFTFDCVLLDSLFVYPVRRRLLLGTFIDACSFCKHQLNLKLQGITNAPSELSVDAIRVTWLPVFNKFVVAPNLPEIKVVARGYKPNGGGYVLLTAPTIRIFRPVQCKTVGKICKIRGIASVSKVSLSIAHRMINASKETLRDYIADIYITVDQRKGASVRLALVFLTAETTEGIVYHGEAISKPKGEQGNPVLPEDVGHIAACQLLDQIFAGGCVDTTAQALAVTFMTLCEKDVSTYLFGPLSAYCMHTLRHLKKYFEITFKIDDWNELSKDNEQRSLGSNEKVLMTCMGIGFMVPWDDFLIKCSSVSGDAGTFGLFESEWEWLEQLCELAGEGCCSEVDNSFQQIILTLRLDASNYFLKLRRTDSFSITGPEVMTSLGSAFQYSWQNSDTLCSLYHRFIECCLRIDMAVKLCSDVRHPFTFMEWAIDEDDPTCITITLLCEERYTRKSFQLYLMIDWSEPNTFPRAFTSSVPEYLQNLRLDEWDSSSIFADNLNRIFRNLISSNFVY